MQQQHRLPLGLLSLLFCVLVLMAYLVLHHNVDTVVVLRALASLYFLGVAPGYLIQRYVFRHPVTNSMEGLLSCFVLGSLCSPGIWYAMCWLEVSWIFFPLIVSWGIACPLVTGWYRSPFQRLTELVTTRDIPLMLVSLIMVVLWSYTIQFVDVRADQVAIKPHYDLCFHAIQTSELSRGTPAERLPFLYSGGRIAYHHLPHVWSDLLRRTAGTDAHTGFFFLALPLRYLLISAACYLGLVRRFGRWSALCGVVCLLGFVEPAHFNFPKSFLHYLHYSYPTMFGLMVVFLILYYTSLLKENNRRRIMSLVCFLSGLLCFYKANHAIVVMPPVAIFAIWSLGRVRDYKGIVLCLLTQGLPAGLFYLQSLGADMKVPLDFAPFTFVMWWWDRLLLPGGTKEAFQTFVNSFPSFIRQFMILTICVLQRFHVGVAIFVYLIVRCGLARMKHGGKSVDHLICLILLSCIAGFVFLPVQKGLIWNITMHTWAIVSALSFALMGPVIYDLFQRIRLWRHPAALVLMLTAIVGAGTYNTMALRRVALWETHGSSGYVSVPFYDCCRFIQRESPFDSVVLHSLYRENFFVSLLTQRRSVFEYAWLCKLYVNTDSIIADLDDLYKNDDEEKIYSTLSRYHVDYVIADLSTTNLPSENRHLSIVFRSGAMAVYRVDQATLLAESSLDHMIPIHVKKHLNSYNLEAKRSLYTHR